MPQTGLSLGSYTGNKRKLALAFDIGTTYSGISYSILDPGQVPEIKGVMRFPAHEQINGASKIPTVMYYDQGGTMMAAGAEAVREGIYETATDEGWTKVEWFKLHVRWQRGSDAEQVRLAEVLPPLPPNKTVVQVIADFMRYLFKCAGDYIRDTHANGKDLWASVESDIDYVITHPNGWEGYQQSQIREAAVLAGLISDSIEGKEAGKGRVSFLTEGEASLHYSIRNGLPLTALSDEEGLIIVDAGGGTIDLSAYRKLNEEDGGTFEEIGVPQCHFLGSTFVSMNSKLFISKLLEGSRFIEDIDHIVQRFDATTKLRFRSDRDPQFIRFGGNRDNDEAYGIRYGQLKLSGVDVAAFFAPSVNCIVNSVLSLMRTAHNPVSYVILVGGFASNDWLYAQVEKALLPRNVKFIRPENHVIKAVSDGAISYYLRRQVLSRVSKFAYGAIYRTTFNPFDPEHVQRDADAYIGTAGCKKLDGVFKIIIPQNTKIEEKKEYRWAKTRYNFKKVTHLKCVHADIWCYRGSNPNPKWRDEDPDSYARLCRIRMDLSRIPYKTLERVDDKRVYYEILYDYILFYEGTEMKAQTAWLENGVEKRSVAQVVYDPID